MFFFFFFFNDTATTEIYTTRHTLSLHDALPISSLWSVRVGGCVGEPVTPAVRERHADQGEVTADRAGGADLEVRPAQLALDLLVALLDPVAQPVAAHHLGQRGAVVRAAGGMRAVG